MNKVKNVGTIERSLRVLGGGEIALPRLGSLAARAAAVRAAGTWLTPAS